MQHIVETIAVLLVGVIRERIAKWLALVVDADNFLLV
jgi:hypothetical protein